MKNEKNLKIGLQNLGTINKNVVFFEKGENWINLYFSYKTLVGIRGFYNGSSFSFVALNSWSRTTGKLLNELEEDKKKRFPSELVNKKASEFLLKIMGGVDNVLF